MKTVSVSELKARLSQYLREVRNGGEIQVLDRGVAVARLVGNTGSPSSDAHRHRLISDGILRPGKGKASTVLKTPPMQLPTDLRAALDEERGDRL